MQQTTWEKEDRQPALQRLSPAQDQGEQRLAVNAFLTEHWGSTVMMVRGEQGRLSLHAFRGRACAKICLAPAKRASTNENSRRQGRLSLHAFRGRACAKICLAPAKRVSTNERAG